VKILDANLLLYAVNEDAPLHGKARPWLEEALSGTEAVGFEWTVVLAFLRLSTRSAVFPNPLRLDQAFLLIDSWLAQPCAILVQPTERHADHLRELLAPLGDRGKPGFRRAPRGRSARARGRTLLGRCGLRPLPGRPVDESAGLRRLYRR